MCVYCTINTQMAASHRRTAGTESTEPQGDVFIVRYIVCLTDVLKTSEGQNALFAFIAHNVTYGCL